MRYIKQKEVSMNYQNNNQRSNNNCGLVLEDFVQYYLRGDYDQDLHYIFETEYEPHCNGRLWLNSGHWDEIKRKNCECASADPIRNFVFSGIFLYQLMTHLLLWDEMTQKDFESPNGEANPRYLNYEKYVSLLEHLGWPGFGLDIWKEFSNQFSHKKLFFEGLEEILDRYGLMTSRFGNDTYRFILVCIFNVMYGLLQEGVQQMDIPASQKRSILATAKDHSERILEYF
jgi:hypothetical protein